MPIEYIIVGKLGRTRGVNGEIYITPISDSPNRFLGLKEIFVKNGDQWDKIEITSSRMIGNRPVVKFKNINNPEQAARMTNKSLAVTKENLMKLPENSFFIFDLIGSKVYDGKTDNLIGEIVEVKQYPANDVYEIKTTDDKITYCPAVKQFVLTVDIENKKITIDSNGLFNE